MIRMGNDKFDLLCDFNTRAAEFAAAGFIFMAAHPLRQPKTFQEIAGVSGLPVDNIRKAYRDIHCYRWNLLEDN